MAPIAVVLAERVAHPVLGHEDAGEVGVAVEADAEEVEHLALGRLGPGCTSNSDGATGSSPSTWSRTRTRLRSLAR